MRLALISDIHGNMEALTSVLSDIDSRNVDMIASLGDAIGYGPEPNQAIALLQERNIPAILGNHELAAIQPSQLLHFNPHAKASLERTLRLLTPSSMGFIQGLKSCDVIGRCRIVHGFPPDSPLVYAAMASVTRTVNAFRDMPEAVCFAGHTHILQSMSYDGRQVSRSLLRGDHIGLDEGKQYIITVGSVGQPRDGDNRAKYVIWDSRNHQIELRRIPYDIKSVSDKIIRMGFPAVHAHRLW